MDETNKRIAANIKGLRNAMRESQMDLAASLGLSGPSTISMYESGKRIPDLETLSKIAGHFRIAVDELVNNDYSEASVLRERHVSIEEYTDALKKILPIAYSDEAMEKDTVFARTYKAHLNLIDAIKMQDEAGIVKYLEACDKGYEKSIKERKTIESVANRLWIEFFYGMISQHTALFEYNPDVAKRDNTLRENMIVFFLKHFDDEEATERIEESKKERKRYFKGMNRIILQSIKILKCSKKWAPLADYYLALYYLYDMAGNGLNETMNVSIGRELMNGLRKLENPYVEEFENLAESYYE